MKYFILCLFFKIFLLQFLYISFFAYDLITAG